MIKTKKYKGSYTIEAAIYIPIILCIIFQSINLSIDFWQQSKSREVYEGLQNLDTTKEFYTYQILEEVGEEIKDD